MPLNVLLLGPQGAGKGTQAKRIAAEYDIPHIGSGELVSDDLMIELIRTRLGQHDTDDGFILDGFPRTTVQAEALDNMFNAIGRSFGVVFALQIPDEVAFERLSRRAE